MEADANWNNKNGATKDILMADIKYSNIVLKSTMTSSVFLKLTNSMSAVYLSTKLKSDVMIVTSFLDVMIMMFQTL